MLEQHSYYTLGNAHHVTNINDSIAGGAGNQTFSYDQLDRLTNWQVSSNGTPNYTEQYTYDTTGNLLTKAGASNSYDYGHARGGGGPYAVRSTGYSYDANGNMTTQPATTQPSRTLTWNMDNHPTSVTSGGTTTETYRYDADGERILRSVAGAGGGVGTYYLGGLYEEDAPSGTNRTLYQFNGQVVSQRTVDNSTPTNTPTITPTSTSTPTYTPTPTSTSTPKNTPTSTATPTTTPSCPLSSALFYPHYTDIPPVNDGYQMNSSAPSTLGLSVTMGSGKGVNSLSWYSATEPNTSFTSGDYTFYIQVATCATASDPDRVTYKLEYTDPDGSNPVLIGSITQSHWNAGACGGGGGGAQGYTVSIAPAHGQVHLVGKRLRLTATLVNGSPTIYFGTATYLDTPSYYVCTIGGGGGTLPGTQAGSEPNPDGGIQPGTGTQPRATTSVPDSFTTGSKPIDPHDPQSPNVTNTVVYLHSDHLGSISVVTSSTGGVVSSQSFDPWGKVLSGGNVTQTKLNYTGQRLDDTGLLYYHARYYDPVLGRFTSPDSIIPDQYEPQARNRYSYVRNNPLKYADPTGHFYDQPGDAGPISGAAGVTTYYPNKQAAREALPGKLNQAVNKFFRDATGKSVDFQITENADGTHTLKFFSPANNPGYGKLYVQVIDADGTVIMEYKDTMGPDGLIERKWLKGGPSADEEQPDEGNNSKPTGSTSDSDTEGTSGGAEEPPLEGTGTGEEPGSPGSPGLGNEGGFEPGMGGGGNPVNDDGLSNSVSTSWGR